MRPISDTTQTYEITLRAVPTNPVEVSVAYRILQRNGAHLSEIIRGNHFTLSGTTKTELIPALDKEKGEICRHMIAFSLYNPAGNSNKTFDLDFEDSADSSVIAIKIATVGADADLHYFENVGWSA